MLQHKLIDFFLSQPIIAVVGVSRTEDQPANHIFKKFKELQYVVYPVNPHAGRVDGERCYPDLLRVPLAPSAVMLAGTPEVSLKTIQDCVSLNVSVVWMHKGIGEGSYSEAAAALADKHGIKVIKNGCPMMFLGKVDIFHRALKWFKS